MAETSEPCKDHGGEIDFDSDWVERSIQNEIKRGEKLRQQKLLDQSKDAVTSKFSRRPSLARSTYPAKSRRNSSPSSRRRNGLEDLRKRAKSTSPSHSTLRTSSQSGRGSRANSARRGRPVCSMRISELAEPSKRQCLETWRNKADVLPAFMVQRLKQQVMDQKPIVQVSDAITCFKYDKTDAKKRPQRKINKDAMKQRVLEENQNLSVIFGNKLAQKLTHPTKVKLIPRLTNLSTVVISEISRMMKDRQRWVSSATHQRMVREISDKVTVWIADILEDTSEKLLEEDLRVKKMNERIPVTVDGEVITLMNAMVEKETELEEQEGPALDVLEEVVDSVLDICVPSNEDLTEDAYDDSDKDNLSPDYLSLSSGQSVDTDMTQEADDEDSIKKHLMNQLRDIVDTIESNDKLDYDDSTEGHPNVENKESTSYLPLVDINDQSKRDLSPRTDSFQSLPSQNVDKDVDVTTVPVEPDNVNPEEEKSSNVSDTLDILKEEDSIKRVTFSNGNITIGSITRDKEQHINSEEKPYLQEEKDTTQVTSETSSNISLRGIYDSWPNDLPTNGIKPSASVSKSITSLGRILESDEKDFLSPEVEVTSEPLTPKLQENMGVSDNSENANNINTKEGNDLRGFIVELENLGEKINKDSNKDTDSKEYINQLNSNTSNPKKERKYDSANKELNIENQDKDVKLIVEPAEEILETEPVNKIDIKISSENTDKSITDTVYKEGTIVGDQDKELKSIPKIISKSEINKYYQPISTETAVEIFKTDKVFKGMNEIDGRHNSSKESLVSVVLFELQKHGGKSKDFVSAREQSRCISKVHVQCECPQSDKRTMNEQPSSQMQRIHSRTATTAVPKKFDYRVQSKTAPAWLTRGQGEPAEHLVKNFLYPGKDAHLERRKPVQEREREIRKWCNDLDRILINLSKWRNWLEYIAKYINTLKQRADYNKLSKTASSKIITVDRLKPPKTIDKDVKWTKLNKRAKGGLKLFRNDETIQFKISPAAMTMKHYKSCVCSKQTKRLRVSNSTKK